MTPTRSQVDNKLNKARYSGKNPVRRFAFSVTKLLSSNSVKKLNVSSAVWRMMENALYRVSTVSTSQSLALPATLSPFYNTYYQQETLTSNAILSLCPSLSVSLKADAGTSKVAPLAQIISFRTENGFQSRKWVSMPTPVPEEKK